MFCRLNHFDQRHARDRIEEVQADESLRLREFLGQLFEHDARGVGREHCVGFQLRLDARVQLLLRLQVLEDGFDHEIRLRHAGTGTSAFRRRITSSRLVGSG